MTLSARTRPQPHNGHAPTRERKSKAGEARLWTVSSFRSATAANWLSIAVVWMMNVFTYSGARRPQFSR